MKFNAHYHKQQQQYPGKYTTKNKSRWSPFLAGKYQLCTILLLTVAWFLTPLSELISGIILSTVPIEADIQLGYEAWSHSMQYKYPIVNDRWKVHSIGQTLILSTIQFSSLLDQFCTRKKFTNTHNCKLQSKQYPWSFSVIQSPTNEINAFALPGGIIRITDTLLQKLQLTDGEIAALIGHEMGHVLHRHSQARLIKQDLWTMIAKALIYDDEDDVEESFGEAVGEIMLKGASFLGEMRFSRQNEYEADDVAWEILVASKIFDPRCVQSLLEKLWSLEISNHDNRYSYYDTGSSSSTKKSSWDQTHPGTEERIKALNDKWEKLSRDEKRKLSNYPRK